VTSFAGGARAATMAAAFLAILASGCTRDSGGAIAAARPSISTSSPTAVPESRASSSTVVFVDVRTRSVTPLPPALTVFEDASDYRRSPDGTEFVFRADVGDGFAAQLFVGAVDGSYVRRLTDEPLAATEGRWSPDGSHVVFLSGGFMTSRLKTIDVDSGEVRRVDGVPRGAWAPSFTPDGRSIVFSMATPTPRGGWRVDLWTVPRDGGTPTRLIRYGGYAAFSPDGSTLAYHRTAPQASAFCGRCWWIETRLSTADADGSEELGVSEGGMIAPPQAHLMSGARWSPDGSLLLHTGGVNIDGRADIVVRDLRTGAVIHLGSGAWPTWFDDRTVVVTR
jgi:hypothetical protein